MTSRVRAPLTPLNDDGQELCSIFLQTELRKEWTGIRGVNVGLDFKRVTYGTMRRIQATTFHG
jgi:hypothetical protein